MRRTHALADLVSQTSFPLGESGWHRAGPERARALHDATALAPATTALDAEFEGLHLLAWLPALLADAFVITGASAQAIVGVEQVRFIAGVPVGVDVQVRAVLVDGARTEDGHVLCRLGVTLHVADEELPALVAELLLLAGNPAPT